MKRDSQSPRAYRASVEGKQSELLEAIRSTIFEVAPKVDERIEYGMLDYPGIANLAVQKQYVSLYVMSAVLDRHRDRFSGVDCGKSCLRFRRLDQLDFPRLKKLLEDVIRERSRS